MRELKFESGGRKLFNEDLIDVQEHLLSIQNLFVAEQPFILGGMIFTGLGNPADNLYNISEGYVWLNGKIRFIDLQSGIDLSSATYINALDTTEQTTYDDTVLRDSTIDYTYVIGSTPTGVESIRLDPPEDILRYYENILGDKFLQLNSSDIETINSQLIFTSNVTFNGDVTATDIVADTANITGGLTVGSNLNVSGDIVSDGSISGASSITATEIYVTALGTPVINSSGIVGANLVETASIQDNAITTIKLADGAVGFDQIAAGAVISSKINAGAVSTIKIEDGAVTELKIATDAVTADKIAPNAITTNKIADGTVNSGHLNFNTIEVLNTHTYSLPLKTGNTLHTQNHLHSLGITAGTYFVIGTAHNCSVAVSCNTFANETTNEFDILYEIKGAASYTLDLQVQILRAIP